MSLEKEDTKNRILDEAQILFADKGFDGTSIRDIAEKAQVNVASINYHFQNKNNLYQEVVRQGFDTLSSEVEQLAQKQNWSFVDLSAEIFELFYSNKPLIFNSLKIILQEDAAEYDELPSHGHEDDNVGPPGGKVLLNKLSQELSSDVSEDMQLWAVRSLFANIFHFSFILHCRRCRQTNLPFLTPDRIKKDIRLLAKTLKSSLQQKS